MELEGCVIRLDDPSNTYSAGQTVKGQVELTFDKPMKIRGIIICFLGEGNTSCTNRDSRSRTMYDHEESFKCEYYLLGGKNSKEIELASGTYTYPFTCDLPSDLSPSFESQYGHVRYTVKVTLDRPRKLNENAQIEFTVSSMVDLNELFELEQKKCCCCLCCQRPR